MKSGRRSPPAPSALPGAETGQRGGPATEDPEQAVLARGWGLAEALLHAPIAVAMFDRNMRYVAVSSRFVSEYRLPPETELIGRSHYDLFPEISPRWVEIHARVLAGESRSADYDPFPRADGSTDYVRWSMSPWIDANGAIGGAFLVSEVVTDRAGVGQDREERYQRAARAVRVAGLGYGDVDYVADRVSLDPEASRLYGFGYQERTLPRSVVHERIPAEDREGLLRVREAAISPGGDGRFEYEHRVQLNDGSIRWVSTRNQVSFEERPGGRVATRAVLTVFDVTNRARLEEALRESEDFARVALEANPDCIVMLDRAGRVLFVNKAGRRSLGLADGVEVVGEVWRDLWRHSCRASIDSALALALRGSRQRLEVIRDDPDGRETWWEVDLVPASRGESRHGALLAVSRDVSERKRNEAELKVSRNAFQQLIENSPFGILAVDADFRLALVSRGAKQTFRNVHPLLGRDFGEVVRTIWPEPFATEAIEHYRHTLATGEPYHAPSLVERRADTAETESYD